MLGYDLSAPPRLTTSAENRGIPCIAVTVSDFPYPDNKFSQAKTRHKSMKTKTQFIGAKPRCADTWFRETIDLIG